MYDAPQVSNSVRSTLPEHTPVKRIKTYGSANCGKKRQSPYFGSSERARQQNHSIFNDPRPSLLDTPFLGANSPAPVVVPVNTDLPVESPQKRQKRSNPSGAYRSDHLISRPVQQRRRKHKHSRSRRKMPDEGEHGVGDKKFNDSSLPALPSHNLIDMTFNSKSSGLRSQHNSSSNSMLRLTEATPGQNATEDFNNDTIDPALLTRQAADASKLLARNATPARSVTFADEKSPSNPEHWRDFMSDEQIAERFPPHPIVNKDDQANFDVNLDVDDLMSDEDIAKKFPFHDVISADGDGIMEVDPLFGDPEKPNPVSRRDSVQSEATLIAPLGGDGGSESVHEILLSDRASSSHSQPATPGPAHSALFPSLFLQEASGGKPRALLTTYQTRPNDPIAGPRPMNDPYTPFQFQDLPSKNREQILLYGLDSWLGCQIVPYYNHCSVHIQPHFDPEKRDNIAFGPYLSIANHAFHKDITKLFYGTNDFIFQDPLVLKWWYHRIGTSNFSKLKNMMIEFPTGEVYAGRPMDCLVWEKIWSQTLTWLRPLQNLQYLHLNFKSWRKAKLEPDDQQWLSTERYREEVMMALLGFRGIEQVEVKPPTSWHMANGTNWNGVIWRSSFWADLANVMMKPVGELSLLEGKWKEAVIREHEEQGVVAGMGFHMKNLRLKGG